MNEDVKKMWISELRSGKYKQGRHRLKTCFGDSYSNFCCYGVLCDIFLKETGKGKWLDHEYSKKFVILSDNGSIIDANDQVIPIAVAQWAGLASPNPTIKYENKLTTLATLNDELLNFDIISYIIEGQL